MQDVIPVSCVIMTWSLACGQCYAIVSLGEYSTHSPQLYPSIANLQSRMKGRISRSRGGYTTQS